MEAGSREEPEHWLLFIDESGDFDKPWAMVSVGGALVSERAYGPWRISLPSRLKSIAPELPWPPSYKDACSPSLLALTHPGWHRRADAAAAARCDLCRESGAVLSLFGGNRACLDARDNVSRALEIGRTAPASGGFWVLDTWLWANAIGASMTLRGECFERMQALVTSLGGALRDDEAEPAHGKRMALLVAETSTLSKPRGERYLPLVDALLRRIVGLLSRRPGRHEVHVEAATRYVVPRPGDAPRELDAGTLLELGMAVSTAKVLFASSRPLRYHAASCAGLVLADFIASRARWEIASGDLDTVERRVATVAGILTRSGAPPRSHLAAGGRALSVEEGRSPATPRAGERAWAIQQAAEWASSP